MGHSKGKKNKTAKSSGEKKPAEKPLKEKKEKLTTSVEQNKPLKGQEKSTSSVENKCQLPEKQGKDQEISTSSVVKKKPLSGIKVLLVDDNEMLRDLATVLLCNNGAIVEVCEDGKEAFDRVCILLRDNGEEKHIPYHCILMDCEMPIMNGYESTKLIREQEKLYGIRIPIFALTVNVMTEEAISKTKDAGMDSYLTKPLKIDSVVEAITNLPNAPHKKKKPQLEELCDKPPASPDPNKKPLSGKKVLVVVDAARLRKWLTKQLSTLGAIVDVCKNGREAFHRVHNVLRDPNDFLPAYHCILMDYELPKMNGYEATRLIREEEKVYGIQMTIIALMRENAKGEEASKAKDAGMDFHLTKPLKPDKLKKVLTNLPVKE